MSETKYRAPALEKGLDILELLSAVTTPQSMPMIAAELGRSKGEIFRMTTVLERRGYISRVSGTENFVITNRLFELGMRNPPIRNLIDAASPLMHNLAKEVDQSCLLAVASGDQIVVIYSTEATGYLSFAVRIGHRQPLLESTSGLTLLAFQDSDTQEEWLSHEKSKTKQNELRKRIRAIRNRGYEVAPSKMVEGIVDISAPLFNGRSPGPVASLLMPVVAHLKRQETQRVAIQAVRKTASEITDQLSVGYSSSPDAPTMATEAASAK